MTMTTAAEYAVMLTAPGLPPPDAAPSYWSVGLLPELAAGRWPLAWVGPWLALG
jgi:hypothetical protein